MPPKHNTQTRRTSLRARYRRLNKSEIARKVLKVSRQAIDKVVAMTPTEAQKTAARRRIIAVLERELLRLQQTRKTKAA